MQSVASPLKARTTFFQITVLFALFALVILYGVESWRHYFFTGLARHWDPKLMGEWMAWNAHNILHGHFLTPNYHANFFYPHSYTLAFSELLWPESFFYALCYFLTANPFFSFNATMLFFWALSGVLLFLLLLSMDISIAVSALGGLIYCLMPYRMPYYVEFNMVLVFIFPLMILLLKRWLEDPCWQNGLLVCLGYFLSATSCLYFTIMAIIIMVFIFLAFIAGDRSLLRNRKFYLSGCLIAVGVLVISITYLYPYALLRMQGGYQRSITDYLKYFAQPMQYLDTTSAALLHWVKTPRPRFTETFLFPGTALSLLTLIFLAYKARLFFSSSSSTKIIAQAISVAKVALWAFFWSVILIHAFRGSVAWLTPVDPYLYHVAFALILLSIAGLFCLEDNHPTTLVLAGLSAAAVLCFFISFGPYISVGPDSHRLDLARGPFLDLASWNPLFAAVRSLTRFSIVILTYLTVAGCFALHRLIRRERRVFWVLPILAAMMVFEARVMLHYNFEDCTATMNSQVIKKAQHLPGEYVLFELPIAIRKAEADMVMTSIGRFPLLIDGWSGFAPPYYEKLFTWEEGKWSLDRILPWVSEVWPPAYVVVDRSWAGLLEMGWKKSFPWIYLEKNWELIDSDRRYALYRQKPQVQQSDTIVRRVRTDLLRSHPRLSFLAHSVDTAPSAFIVRLNHKAVTGTIPLTTTWKHFSVVLPAKDMGNIEGEEIDMDAVFTSTASHHWEVKDIDFKAAK